MSPDRLRDQKCLEIEALSCLCFLAGHINVVVMIGTNREVAINTRVATSGEGGGGHPSKLTLRISIENDRGGYRGRGEVLGAFL